MAAILDALGDVDELTRNLVLALQLEDAQALGDEEDDSIATASRLYAEEIQQYQVICQLENEETHLAEVSATAASGENEDADCVSCEDRFRVGEVFQAPCSHYYCNGCLEQLHASAMRDETLYPPRCCRHPMPWEAVRSRLSDRLASNFETRKEELDTNPTDRTYCSGPDCQVFIGPDAIVGDLATCPACNRNTCKTCKAAMHDGDCPQDEALQQTLELAREEGWGRCGQCKRIVELTVGCFHMTCLCRSEFCYVCAARWKTCTCPHWDEQRLVTRANAIVNRNPVAAAAPAEQHAELVAQEVQNLRENHECEHEYWEHRYGGGECEVCDDYLRVYLMVCAQCGLSACRRCMSNRL